jgi:hypothetical protein
VVAFNANLNLLPTAWALAQVGSAPCVGFRWQNPGFFDQKVFRPETAPRGRADPIWATVHTATFDPTESPGVSHVAQSLCHSSSTLHTKLVGRAQLVQCWPYALDLSRMPTQARAAQGGRRPNMLGTVIVVERGGVGQRLCTV